MLHRIEIYCGSLAMPPLPSEARKSARAEVEVEVEVKVAAMMLSHLLQTAT